MGKNEKSDYTNIPIKVATRDRLAELIKKKGETWDDIVNRLIDVYLKHEEK